MGLKYKFNFTKTFLWFITPTPIFVAVEGATALLGLAKPRKVAPPKIRRWISENQDEEISKIVVCRKPVAKAIKSVLNTITFGRFNNSLNKLNYDDIFHLYIYLTINGVTWRIEKNEVVSLVIDEQDKGEDCKDINLSRKRRLILLGDFIKNGEDFQENFWNYHPKNNNCQDFAISLLRGNELITKGGKCVKFIKQDAETIFNNNPGYLEGFGGKVTDIAGFFDVVLNGY